MWSKQLRSWAVAIPLVATAFAATSANAVYVNGDDWPDALSARLSEIQSSHRDAMYSELHASSDPVDWLVISLLQLPSPDGDLDREQRGDLVRRAIALAPSDATLQWLALRNAYQQPDMAAEIAQVLENLQRLEADNGAVWLEVFENAISAKRIEDAETALIRLAAATRFDDHHADVLRAIAQAVQRHPLPDEYFSLIAQRESGSVSPVLSKNTVPYIYATAASTMALPAYDQLIQACEIASSAAVQAEANTCEKVGRLMSAHGSDRLTNRIGFSLLRLSGRFSEDDVQRSREQDWVWQQKTDVDKNALGEQAAAVLIANMQEWIDTNSELEAARREIERAGKPSMPSVGWIDSISPFPSAELNTDHSG